MTIIVIMNHWPSLALQMTNQYEQMNHKYFQQMINKYFQGLGFANIFAQSFVGLYYNMVTIIIITILLLVLQYFIWFHMNDKSCIGLKIISGPSC